MHSITKTPHAYTATIIIEKFNAALIFKSVLNIKLYSSVSYEVYLMFSSIILTNVNILRI
jgi:hypothetical protein